MTFGVIGLLSTYLQTNLRWAYIPAAVLLVLGLVVMSPFAGSLGFVWPLLLIAGGAYLVLRRTQTHQSTAHRHTIRRRRSLPSQTDVEDDK